MAKETSMSYADPDHIIDGVDNDVRSTLEDSQEMSPPPVIHRTNTLTPSSLKKLLLNNDVAAEQVPKAVATRVAADSLGISPSRPACEMDSTARSPGASTYYCSGSLRGRSLPCATPAAATISASLPHRRSSGSLSSSSVASPSEGSATLLGGPHHLRVASLSSLSSLSHTQPRLQAPFASRATVHAPAAIPSAGVCGVESGFAHFTINGKRVHQLPQSLGAEDRGVPRAPHQRTPARASSAQLPMSSGPNSPFSGSLQTTSMLLPEQDATSDDLFTSKEFLAFLNGKEEVTGTSVEATSTTTGFDSANPFTPGTKDISLAICSSCDLSFSDCATAFGNGNIFDAEAAKAFSRDGAKRAANVRVLM